MEKGKKPSAKLSEAHSLVISKADEEWAIFVDADYVGSTDYQRSRSGVSAKFGNDTFE